MMNVFYLGANTYKECLHLLENAQDTILLYEDADTVTERSSVIRLQRIGKAFKIEPDEWQSAEKGLCETLLDNREQIHQRVINDSTLPLLSSRFERFEYTGSFAKLSHHTNIIDRAISFFNLHRPKSIHCAYSPHTLNSWLFIRALEESGAKIIRLTISPLPWIFTPVLGLDPQKCRTLDKKNPPTPTEKIVQYINKLSKNYSAAKPWYEIANKNLKTNSIPTNEDGTLKRLSFFRRISISNILAHMEKKLIKKEHQSISEDVDFSVPFAVYFLHYQPEGNTLPDAGFYCDQFQAILKLSLALPLGVRLIVKEHPSTFSTRCDLRWRPRGFYERICSIENVILSKIDIDPFTLIDQGVFVASISGVCLVEALARKKVAITFDSAKFNHFSDEFVIDANKRSVAALKTIFKKIQCHQWGSIDKSSLIQSMKETSVHGLDGSSSGVFIPSNRDEIYEITRAINIAYINDILQD